MPLRSQVATRLPHLVGRSRLLLLAGLAFLVVQVLLPLAVAVTQDPPARFGWHMFSSPGPAPVLTLDDGRELTAFDVFAQPRPEIDYASPDVVGYVCRRFGTESVTVEQRGEPPTTEACE